MNPHLKGVDICFIGGVRSLKEISSIEELEEYMLEQTKLAMDGNDGLGNYISDCVKDKVDEIVYSSYSPKTYERTFELRDSIKCLNVMRDANQITAEINHDLDLIHSYYPNKHHSVSPYETENVSKFIPAIVINNKAGFFMGYGVDGRYHNIGDGKWRVPKPYFKKTIQDFEKSSRHISKMLEILRSNGNEVEIL